MWQRSLAIRSISAFMSMWRAFRRCKRRVDCAEAIMYQNKKTKKILFDFLFCNATDCSPFYDYYHNLNNAQNDNVYYTNSEDYCYFNPHYFNAYLKIVFKLSVTGLCKKKGGYITWSFREN